jgi:hypothetical protein
MKLMLAATILMDAVFSKCRDINKSVSVMFVTYR